MRWRFSVGLIAVLVAAASSSCEAFCKTQIEIDLNNPCKAEGIGWRTIPEHAKFIHSTINIFKASQTGHSSYTSSSQGPAGEAQWYPNDPAFFTAGDVDFDSSKRVALHKAILKYNRENITSEFIYSHVYHTKKSFSVLEIAGSSDQFKLLKCMLKLYKQKHIPVDSEVGRWVDEYAKRSWFGFQWMFRWRSPGSKVKKFLRDADPSDEELNDIEQFEETFRMDTRIAVMFRELNRPGMPFECARGYQNGMYIINFLDFWHENKHYCF